MNRFVGVITNNRHHVFQRTVIAGIESVMHEREYGVLVDSIAEDASQPQPVSLKLSQLAGLIVISNIMPDDFLRDTVQTMPLTLVSHHLAGEAIPAVIPDNVEGIARMVDFLVEDCQRQRIVFIQGDMNQNDGRQRTYAFRQRLKRHDLSLPDSFFLRGDFVPEIAAASLHDFLRTNRGSFDSVAAADYMMGVAALNVLRDNKLRVPQDVAVVAFGDGAEAAHAGLTTISVDVMKVGQRAARQLLGQIDGLKIRGTTIPGTDIIRRSTS